VKVLPPEFDAPVVAVTAPLVAAPPAASLEEVPPVAAPPKPPAPPCEVLSLVLALEPPWPPSALVLPTLELPPVPVPVPPAAAPPCDEASMVMEGRLPEPEPVAPVWSWVWAWVLPPESDVVLPTAPPAAAMSGVKVMVGFEEPPWPLAVTAPLVAAPPKPPAPPVASELPPAPPAAALVAVCS